MERLQPDDRDEPPRKQPRIDSQPPPSNLQQCLYCGIFRPTISTQGYCTPCLSRGRQCATCKRPLPEHCYETNNVTCTTCLKKTQRQRGKGRRHTALDGNVVKEVLSGDGEIDIPLYLRDRRDQIATILARELSEKRGIKFYLVLRVRYVKFTIEG